MNLKTRLENIEKRMQAGRTTVYLKGGSKAFISGPELLDLLCCCIMTTAELTVGSGPSTIEHRLSYLFDIAAEDVRQDKTFEICQKMAREVAAGGY